MTKSRDLHFGYRGNGLSVYDVNSMKDGDYESVAHINTHREIKYYTKNLSQKDIEIIEHQAKTADPNVSATQEQKVFLERPKQD